MPGQGVLCPAASEDKERNGLEVLISDLVKHIQMVCGLQHYNAGGSLGFQV